MIALHSCPPSSVSSVAFLLASFLGPSSSPTNALSCFDTTLLPLPQTLWFFFIIPVVPHKAAAEVSE